MKICISKDVDKWIEDSQKLAGFLELKMGTLLIDNPELQVYRTSLRRLIAFSKSAVSEKKVGAV